MVNDMPVRILSSIIRVSLMTTFRSHSLVRIFGYVSRLHHLRMRVGKGLHESLGYVLHCRVSVLLIGVRLRVVMGRGRVMVIVDLSVADDLDVLSIGRRVLYRRPFRLQLDALVRLRDLGLIVRIASRVYGRLIGHPFLVPLFAIMVVERVLRVRLVYSGVDFDHIVL